MPGELIQENVPGVEIPGTRLSVYDLMPYFVDPTVTEGFIARLYDLSLEQVAAARAAVFAHADIILARHLKLEERTTSENPPEVIERARATQKSSDGFQDMARQPKAGSRFLERGQVVAWPKVTHVPGMASPGGFSSGRGSITWSGCSPTSIFKNI